MRRLDARLADLLEPVRDTAVSALLQAIACRLDSGAHVEHEPEMRDPSGHVVREGQLQLPRRGDLEVTTRERKLVQRVDCERMLGFEPVTLIEPDGFVVVIAPFRWDAAEVFAEGVQGRPNWVPIRRWFLEWFQSRYTELSPDLDGAVHAIGGPQEVEGGWRFLIDFGSAPIDCVADMIGAFSETGVARLRMGAAMR